MANDNIRVLGGLELLSTLSYDTDFTDFPANPKPRTLIVKEGMAYLYTELVVGSGYYTWTPIGLKQTAYLHTQGVASTTWTVTHNFGTSDFGYFVYDNNHHLVVANITVVDNSTVLINLSEAITGTAVFFSIQHVSAPNVNAVDSMTINTMTLRDSTGVLTVNNNAVAMEESVAARFATVYTSAQSSSAIASAVSAEEVLRAAADAALGARIDSVLSNIDSTSLDSLTEIVAAFQASDSTLNGAITALSASASSALATEITNRGTAVASAIVVAAADATAKVLVETNARQNADATNSSAITTEYTRAVAAELVLTSGAASEVTARALGDSNTLADGKAYADSKVSTEASTRAAAVTAAIATAAADATAKVLTETTRATAAEATLTTGAATEVTNRNAAIGVETTRAVAAELALTTGAATEVTNRGTAVTAAIATAASDATAKVAAEAALRVSGDASTLVTAKAYADGLSSSGGTASNSYADNIMATEVTNRGTAVTAAIATAASDATAKVAAEAALRVSGDASTLASAKAYANAQIVPTVQTYLSAVTADIVPAVNLVGNLGSLTHQFHSVYVGPGTLYVNGKAVIQDNSDTMTFSTDANQNMKLKTTGSGHLQLETDTGVIDVNSTLSMQAGRRITDAAGINVEFGSPVQMNNNKIVGLATPTANTDASTKAYVDGLTTGDTTLVRTSGAQSIAGVKTFADGIVVSGNLTVSGTMTTINSETIKLADNLIDLNSNFTSGAPTENAGIRIMRGDEPGSQLRWNESVDKWEVSADSVNFSVIAVLADVTAEATARTSGDAATLVSAKSYADAGDVTTLASAKSYTDAAGSTEVSARNIAIATNLVTAKSYADAGDTTTLASAKTYADGVSTTEVAARNLAIGVETTRATAAEAVLTSGAATEVTNRTSSVTAAIATAASDATAKVLTETNARVSAVTSAIATAASDATAKVLTETNARVAADSAEVTARNAAITAGVVASAAKLTTARAINGVVFDGTVDITVTASASTLTGTIDGGSY